MRRILLTFSALYRLCMLVMLHVGKLYFCCCCAHVSARLPDIGQVSRAA